MKIAIDPKKQKGKKKKNQYSYKKHIHCDFYSQNLRKKITINREREKKTIKKVTNKTGKA